MRSIKSGCCLRLFVSEKFGMRRFLFVCVATSLLVVGGCKERRSGAVVHDACNLLSKEKVESVQAAPVNDVKSSEHSDGVFLVSQCFYTAAEFSKSVNLAVIQKDPDNSAKQSPKDFWKEKFGRFSGDEEARNNNKQESEREEEK